MIDTAILGASGFVGGELLRLLAGHPGFAPTRLFGDSDAGKSLGEVHPQLGPFYPGAGIEAFDPSALEGVGLIFAALPHGKTQEIAPAIVDRGIPFVDLGADFRFDRPADYQSWYGEPHRAPAFMERFVYGIPEVKRDAIRSARAVAAAGCYATAAILALRPLVDLVEPGSLIVDAASGVSGAGKATSSKTHFNTVDENFTAYGLLNHRHTGEMEMVLGGPVLFTPHLAPINRGIFATCHGKAVRACDPLETLRAFYADEPFVHVVDEPPSTKWTMGSNMAFVTARFDARTGRILAFCALDNLVKGAAGQMIQCANLMLGMDETSGLGAAGVWP